MALDKKQLTQAIIAVLECCPRSHMLSGAAINLLVFTAAHESLGGTYISQVGGPARGIFQMEPFTCRDVESRAPEDLRAWLLGLRGGRDHAYALMFHLDYAIAMARVHYYMFKEPLPAADNIAGQAKYWKKYWNTSAGKGTEEKAIRDYKLYAGL